MIIALGSDHAGYELKQLMLDYVHSLGYETLDCGAHSTAPSDYPDYAQAVGEAVRDAQAERGILICGSGAGASIAANKIRGVRAALAHDHYTAHQSVEHDDANVLVLGSRIIGEATARDVVEAFLRAEFSNEERHVRRLHKVLQLENKC